MWSKYIFLVPLFMSSNSNSIKQCGWYKVRLVFPVHRGVHCAQCCCRSFILSISPLCSRFSSRFTSLTLMMRITSLIRMSFCTKLGRYGTLAPVLQIRLCLPPAITKVSPTVSFCLWLLSLPLLASCCSIFFSLLFIFLFFLSFSLSPPSK